MHIVNNSKVLSEGDIFVLEEAALKFLPEILHKKPSKILVPSSIVAKVEQEIGKTPYEIYSNSKEIVSLLKSRYQLPKHIWAITGTNGKTSTASFISQMWKLFGIDNISIGTLGVIKTKDFDIDIEINNTTPSMYDLYRILDQARENGIDHVVFEASSHGLHQKRINGIEVEMAGITNFTQDHLDYHGNMDEYFAAKKILFNDHLNGKSIINIDDTYAKKLIDNNSITYGYAAEADIKITSKQFIEGGFDTKLSILGNEYKAFIPVSAEFQLYNIAAVIAFFIAADFKVDNILRNIEKLSLPQGRMQEIVYLGKNTNVFIDYAHTPDALEKALLSIKNTVGSVKPVVVLFGCGGNRDKTKRSIMGNIAAKIADKVIITDDNPRNEDPASIRRDIIGSHKDLIEIADRKSAINYCIKTFYPQYVILIAGKGHENYQIIGNDSHHFDDFEESFAAIRNYNK